MEKIDLEVKILDETYKEDFDKIVSHPIQSWAWGEFKKEFGAIPERIGSFENEKLIKGMQIIFSKLPKVPYTIGYCAKGRIPVLKEIALLEELAKKYKAVFIKIEPDFAIPVFKSKEDAEKDFISSEEFHNKFFFNEEKYLFSQNARRGSAVFKEYNFLLEIEKSEEELQASFNSKTRYNIRLAEKRGVKIKDNSTQEGIENYIRLMEETTKRQGFLNHNADYFRKLFSVFPKERLRIFEAVYEDTVLTSWILFNFNGKLYYPYGASSNMHRDLMPNNLIMWEAVKYGKRLNCKIFDLWGCLGPAPDKKDPWYGFHKFKAGYNPQLMQYIGTYDFVYKPVLYSLFNIADKIRKNRLQKKKQKIKEKESAASLQSSEANSSHK